MITLEQYFGPYADHADATDDVYAAANAMLEKVNRIHDAAEADGHVFKINPKTASLVSGERNGGFRPQDCPIGSASSPHKLGRGVDTYDPDRTFARWCLKNLDKLEAEGLYMEDPRWTPTWTHLDDRGPKSGKRVFVPSTEPALAKALPEQGFA